jgi:hypothetical protein
MRRHKRKPRYTVNVGLKAYDLSKAGTAVTLIIREDAQSGNALLGTIEIGQGTFGWRSANAKRFRRIDWRTLARRLNEHS